MMNFDIKWVVIGGVLLLLLVLFGNNPGEDAMRAREEAANAPDALIRAIEERNAGGGGLGGFADAGGSALPLPGASTGADTSSMYPGYLTRDGNPFAQGLDQPPPVDQPFEMPPESAFRYDGDSAPETDAPSPDSYYPPAPQAPSLDGPQSSLWFQQRLSTGQPLEFSGTRVYAVNPKGEKVAMPDGVYKMQGSAVTLVVRDGHKLAIQ